MLYIVILYYFYVLTFHEAFVRVLVDKDLFCATPMSVYRRFSWTAMNFEVPSVSFPIGCRL